MDGVKETEKMKRVKRLVFNEEFRRKRKLWVTFFFSVILSVWCSIPRFYLPSLLPVDITNAFNIIVQGLTFSVIAGTIVYIISEFLPRCHDLYERLSSIADNIYTLKEDYDSIMAVSCERDEKYEDDFNPKAFMSRVVSEDITGMNFENSLIAEEFDKDVHIKPEYLYALSLIVDKINTSLQTLMMQSYYLKPGEVCMLTMVKSCTLLHEIERRYSYGASMEEKALLIRFGQLKWDVYDYKFVRDGLEQLLNSYRRYIVLENVE